MKVLSLFSGIGAFEKALDNLNLSWELVGYSEIDKAASRSYSAIHGVPESLNLGDITAVDEKALPKDIDLITYGFPCQDISSAGRQKGLFNADGSPTRSGLFFDALRIIKETQPRIAIAENVKALTSEKFSAQFKIVLESLKAAGYNSYWQVLNAKDYGVPQNRERVFIVSIRRDVDTGLFEFPKPVPLQTRLKDILDDEVDEKYYLPVNRNAGQAGASGKDRATAAAMRGRYNEDGKVEQRVEVSDREYANALTTVQKDSLIQNNLRIRKPTSKECFRLMGFDDTDFEKAAAVSSDTQLYKQAGNSIVVPVIERIFVEVRKEIKET